MSMLYNSLQYGSNVYFSNSTVYHIGLGSMPRKHISVQNNVNLEL